MTREPKPDENKRGALRALNADIAAAIAAHMGANPELSPSDILAYFEEARDGLRVGAAFAPSRETFLDCLRFEQ